MTLRCKLLCKSISRVHNKILLPGGVDHHGAVTLLSVGFWEQHSSYRYIMKVGGLLVERHWSENRTTCQTAGFEDDSVLNIGAWCMFFLYVITFKQFSYFPFTKYHLCSRRDLPKLPTSEFYYKTFTTLVYRDSEKTPYGSFSRFILLQYLYFSAFFLNGELCK